MRDWERIRTEYGPMVWKTVHRILRNESDALDCYQEVMIEAYRKDAEVQITNLPGLLRWLAVHRSLDVLRANKRDICASQSDGIQVNEAIQQSCVSEELELNELIVRLRRELAQIPSNQAEAFWLCCVEQLSYQEAADQMATKKSHVGVLVHRARERLRAALDDIKPISIHK